MGEKNEDFWQNSLVGGCEDCAKSGGGRLSYDVIKLNWARLGTNLYVSFVTLRSSPIHWISLMLPCFTLKRVTLDFV